MGPAIDILDQHVNVGVPASGSQLQQLIKLLWRQSRAQQGSEGLAARAPLPPWEAERSLHSQM